MFKVKIINFKGGWNKEVNFVSIIVLLLWYRIWWVYILYILVGVVSIFVYLKYNKNKEELKYKVKIVELESKKEKEVVEK